jgi:CHAT domain-containing protein
MTLGIQLADIGEGAPSGDAVEVTIGLQPAGPGQTGYLSSVTVGDRPAVIGRFEPPADGWDQIYQGAQTSQDGASVGPAIDIGMQLFDGLFSGPLRRCWAQVVEESNGKQMRLVICSASLVIHGLPWELLFDRVLVDRHLALVEGWSVVRTVPGPPPALDPVHSVAELRVLVVTSQTGTEIESDFEILKQAWPQASVRLCRAKGSTDIADALRAQPVDVLHIASSGIELGNGRQYIRLGDPNGTDPMAVVVFLSGGELLGLLENSRLPGLVVLAGSETEVIAAELAHRVPAVVGLRSAVSDVELDPFLKEFYPALGRGDSLDQAMSTGRSKQRSVTSALGIDWAAPVGYFAADQRIVAPRARPGPPELAPAPTGHTVVLTGDRATDQANLWREISALTLQAQLARWNPVNKRLRPELVTRRITTLQADIADPARRAGTVAGTVRDPAIEPMAAPSGPKAGDDVRLLAKGVRAYQLLEQRRALLARLTALIDKLGDLDLLAVAGERWLCQRLHAQLATAQQALTRIAAGAVELAAVEPVEQPLNAVEWSVAAARIAHLEPLCRAQDAAVQVISEDRDTYRLWFDRYRRELALAIEAGVQASPDDRQMLTECGALMSDADAGAKHGHFGAVAVALRTMRAALEQRKLWDPAAFEEYIAQIVRSRTEAERRAAVMAHRSELILIAASQDARPGRAPRSRTAAIEYGVLLRRPSLEAAQESNLHQTMTISADDRRDFLATLDEIAKIAVAGIRGADEKVLAPAPAGDVSSRGIRPAAPTASEKIPDAELKHIGKLMYNLLVPNGMQRLLEETTPCPLTVSSNDLELPWELMHDQTDFLCVKRPFARMPVGKTYPRHTRWIPPNRTAWNMLLIHSDPYDNLRDSHAEITEIQQIFNGLPQVNATLLDGDQATGRLLTRHLSDGRYDLIHYAGHAGFDLAEPDQSFLLLHGEERFSADRIQKVLDGRPVVFLNACNSSQTNNEDETASTDRIAMQAQGLASAFIYGGAQACVGAMWPIFDDSARALAVAFYQALLARQPVGEALCAARAFSRGKHSDRLTWAAYTLYGDPRFKLREGAPASHVPAIVESG